MLELDVNMLAPVVLVRHLAVVVRPPLTAARRCAWPQRPIGAQASSSRRLPTATHECYGVWLKSLLLCGTSDIGSFSLPTDGRGWIDRRKASTEESLNRAAPTTVTAAETTARC